MAPRPGGFCMSRTASLGNPGFEAADARLVPEQAAGVGLGHVARATKASAESKSDSAMIQTPKSSCSAKIRPVNASDSAAHASNPMAGPIKREDPPCAPKGATRRQLRQLAPGGLCRCTGHLPRRALRRRLGRLARQGIPKRPGLALCPLRAS